MNPSQIQRKNRVNIGYIRFFRIKKHQKKPTLCYSGADS